MAMGSRRLCELYNDAVVDDEATCKTRISNCLLKRKVALARGCRRPKDVEKVIKPRFIGLNIESCTQRYFELSELCLAIVLHSLETIPTRFESLGLHTKGIYRVSGDISKIHCYRLFIDGCYDDPFRYQSELWKEPNTHNLAGLLKTFIRELHHCLIPFDFVKEHEDRFQQSQSERVSSFYVDLYNVYIQQIGVRQQRFLRLILKHLQKIINSENSMGIDNVAKIFGPTICEISTESIKSTILAAKGSECRLSEYKKMVEYTSYTENLMVSLLAPEFIEKLFPSSKPLLRVRSAKARRVHRQIKMLPEPDIGKSSARGSTEEVINAKYNQRLYMAFIY